MTKRTSFWTMPKNKSRGSARLIAVGLIGCLILAGVLGFLLGVIAS